uniref:Uncharacterized protein n=1 Tax=Rhizophora mucronata TaxID=61149 RepID=A0A2P2IHU9_RHIMU
MVSSPQSLQGSHLHFMASNGFQGHVCFNQETYC